MGIIIYPPTIDWNWMKQRPQHLMYQLAEKGHLVFYCNQTQKDLVPEQVHPNLYVVHNHKNWLQSVLSSLRKEYSFVGIWCSYPKLASTLNIYKPDWIVYDCIDDFAEWSIYEEQMVSISNAVVCSSSRLKSRLQRTFPHKEITLIQNAYDPSMDLHKSKSSKPPIEYSNKKIVGYVGAWAPWVDEKLVRKIAKIDHDLSVVIIGPEFGRKFLPKDGSPIQFLGLKSHHELPQYIQHMSICIIPFRITDVTLATNPVKAYEYLASGNPVVTTDLPECRLMEPYVDVARTHTEFINQIKERIVNPGDPIPRINYALNNTWMKRAIQIEKIIAKLITQ